MALEDFAHQEQASPMADPAYAQMVFGALRSQGLIPTVGPSGPRWAPGDEPNVPLAQGKQLQQFGLEAPRPTPQINTIGELQALNERLKGLPDQIRIPLISRLTGQDFTVDPVAQRQLQLAQAQALLKAPELRANRQLREQEAMARIEASQNANELRQQALELRRETAKNQVVQQMNIMTQMMERLPVGSTQRQAIEELLLKSLQQAQQLGGLQPPGVSTPTAESPAVLSRQLPQAPLEGPRILSIRRKN